MKLREKSPEELQIQVSEAESVYEQVYNEHLIIRSWGGINKYELQEDGSKYKVRYEQYVNLLRQKKRGVSDPVIKEEARVLITGS